MNLVKTIFKVFTVVILCSSANVFSADFLVNTTIQDDIGEAVGGWKYEIDKMHVEWADDGLITVDIYTNFVDYNNKYGTGSGNGKIVLGDLLIGTSGEISSYDYAFILSSTDRQEDRYYDQNHWNNTGTFSQINSTITSKDYHNGSSSVQSDQVLAGDTVGAGQASAWTVDRQNTGQDRDNYDLISFSFNVNGIDAFQNASQLAFSWAMSCANDVVQGVVNVDRPSTNSIPEPPSLLLMLLALVFLAMSNSKKDINL